MSRPLDGIKVLDLTRLLPGPFLTMLLGDMGADVIKVEDPRVGDYMRQMPPHNGGINGRFLSVNRNKRSLGLDLKSDVGRDAFLRMVDQADIVVETFRPGVRDRLGVGYAALRERNPKIIMCAISGYGQTGPYVHRAGHDLNYIATAGVLAMGGPRGGAPAMPGIQIADLAGGGLWGLSAVLAALVGRERTGHGAFCDVSMTEGSLALMASEMGNFDCGLPDVPTRGTQTLNGGLACYRVYETKDGKYLSVGALEPKFWMALNTAIGRKGNMADLIAPAERQEEIAAEIGAVFKTRTRDEWTAHLAAFDCCTEPVLEIDELRDHELHRARDVFFDIVDPDIGTMTQVRTPVGARGTNVRGPKLGEHSAEVLAEYGVSDEEIAALG